MIYTTTAIINEGEADEYTATISFEYDDENDDVIIVDVSPFVDPAYEETVWKAALHELSQLQLHRDDAFLERQITSYEDRHCLQYWEWE